jgi:hypothetical protein
MLKKLCSYILLAGLLLSQIGVSAYMHYCNGELAHLSLTQPDTEPCGCNGDDDCCKDIIVKAKPELQLFSSDAAGYFKLVKFKSNFISDYFKINILHVFNLSEHSALKQKFRWLPPDSIELLINSVFLRL